MNLSLRELNELIYCIDVARKYGQLLGTTVADTLAVKLRDELDKRLQTDDYISSEILEALKEFNKTPMTFVSDKKADENPKVSRIHIEEDVFTKILRNISEPINSKGVTQSILDYVEFMGEATYSEMQNYYRSKFGSNSFSHILISLVVPYKNRITRRYLYKTASGKYVVRVAGLHNWVEKDY